LDFFNSGIDHFNPWTEKFFMLPRLYNARMSREHGPLAQVKLSA
jgi:hypothetical protein